VVIPSLVTKEDWVGIVWIAGKSHDEAIEKLARISTDGTTLGEKPNGIYLNWKS
jgi:hypothetical protein